MIRLTRINHTSFYLNSDLIEFVEVTPDTVISLVDGGKVMTLESAEEVVRRVVEFRRRILPLPGAGPVEPALAAASILNEAE